jgi:hypothetical protein
MRRFLIIAISLVMFFATGIQLDFGDDIEMPEWVEEFMSGDKGSRVNMTNSPLYKITRTRMAPMGDEFEPLSAR